METSGSKASIFRKYWEIITLIVLTAYCLAYELCSKRTVFTVLYALAYLHLMLHTISFEVRGWSVMTYHASLLILNPIQIFFQNLINPVNNLPFTVYTVLHIIAFLMMAYKKFLHNSSGKPGSDAKFYEALFGVYIVTQVIALIVFWNNYSMNRLIIEVFFTVVLVSLKDYS